MAAGIVLNAFWSRRITSTRGVRPLGGSLIIVGAVVAAWATRTAGPVDLERPARLVTRGPYAVSRHPMYVAWTLIEPPRVQWRLGCVSLAGSAGRV